MSELIKNDIQQGYTHPGEVLKAEREKKNLTIKDIASTLNLPQRFIAYLETGDYNQLPGHTFARGYIRNYARLIHLTNEQAEELVNFFDNYTGTNAIGSEVSNLTQIKQLTNFSNGFYWLISFIVGLVIIGIIFIWWQSYSTKTAPTVTTDSQPIVVEPVATNSVDTTTSQITIPLGQAELGYTLQPASGTASTNAVLSQETTTQETVTKPEQTTETATTPSSTARLTGRIQASFKSNCWVTLTDASGKILVNKLFAAGSKLDMNVKAPAELILGAPSAASVVFDGKPVVIDTKLGVTQRIKLGQ